MRGSIIQTLVDAAKGLRISGGTVKVSSAAPPVSGQVLTAISSTEARWQQPTGDGAGGGGSSSGSFSDGISVTGTAIFYSGIQHHINIVTSTPYTGVQGDYIIAASFPIGTSGVIVLPSGLSSGTFLTIKDDNGVASGFNITVSGLPNIDGSGKYVLDTSYESISVYKSTGGWRIV